MQVPAVARVDDRDTRVHRCGFRRAFQRMADHQNVRVAAYNRHRILQALALADRGALRIVKTDDLASQTEHCRLERHLCAG